MGLPCDVLCGLSCPPNFAGDRSEGANEGPPQPAPDEENRNILRRCAVAEVEAWGREQKVCTKYTKTSGR